MSETLTNNKILQHITEPRMWRVLILNDDESPMEFVVSVLKEIFHKNRIDAEKIMRLAHTTGKAVCGIYVKEIAETKLMQVHDQAKAKRYPLQARMEEDV